MRIKIITPVVLLALLAVSTQSYTPPKESDGASPRQVGDEFRESFRTHSSTTPDKTEFPAVYNEVFKRGELLEYRVHYGFIDAGVARVEVKQEEKKIGGRNVYHVVGTGTSNGIFDWFFKVRDRYETYIDEQGIFPWVFQRRVNEGGFLLNQDYTFLQHKDTVDNGSGKKYNVPKGTQDMLSAFYFARTQDYSGAKPGDIFALQAFVDDSLYPIKIKYMGTDTISTDMGKFSCIKFVPVVQKGRIFKKEEDLMVYVSNDKNKIPILAEAKIIVGSIKMEIQHYSGLTNPLARLE